MCTTCGCGAGETRIEGEQPARMRRHLHVRPDGTVYVHDHAHDAASEQGRGGADADGADHAHEHLHGIGDVHAGAAHAPGMSQTRMVQIEQDILAKNDAYASENRRRLADRGVFAVNLVSSPGSGKTTLLVKTIEAIGGGIPVAVIEGDQQTTNDAERIRATGAPALQINTGKGCHLDAHMVGRAIERLDLADGSLLLIENVGNLVCPAEFDLGEAHKVVILSVTEGEDKPLKYPNMFRAADLMLLAKVDLLPYLSFDVAGCIEHARRVNPSIEVLPVSALSGDGLGPWLEWLVRGVERARAGRAQTVDAPRRRGAELEARVASAGSDLR